MDDRVKRDFPTVFFSFFSHGPCNKTQVYVKHERIY